MNINHLMYKTGLNIKEMCDLLDVNRDTLYKWRSGSQRPSNATVRLFVVIEWLYDKNILDNFIEKIMASNRGDM